MPNVVPFSRKAWHHMWLLWTPTLAFAWMSLIHAGLAARRRDWIAFGALYATPMVLQMTFNPGSEAGVVAVLSCLIAFTHAWVIRPAYLEAMVGREALAAPPTPALPAPYVDGGAVQVLADARVDVNNAPAIELAALPGVGMIGAEVALRLRAERGGFRSAEDFVDALALPEALAAQVRPQVAIAPLRPDTVTDWMRGA